MNIHKVNLLWRRTIAKVKRIKFNPTLTLLISLVGGAPGIINIAHWINERPKFGYYNEVIWHGNYMQNGITKVEYIGMTGAIYNDGDLPLFPSHFTITITIDGKESTYSASALVDTLFSKPAESKLQLSLEKANDITRIIRINPHDAVYGTLVFPINNITYIAGSEEKIKLACTDILQVTTTINVPLGHTNNSGNIFFPHSGLHIK